MADGRKLLTVDDKHAYVLMRDHRLAVVRLDTGEIRHRIPAPGFTIGIPSPEDGAVYLADETGRIFCARSEAVPPVSRQAIRAALRPAAPQEPTDVAVASVADQAEEQTDVLRTRDRGKPVGGKSRISKRWGEDGGG